MRIIGGRMKGRQICPPVGYNARPTTDFAREGLFNVLDNEYDFEEMKVLDLFGGTGAVAFEFASRGAGKVYSVEMARENATFIKTEAAKLGLDNVVMVRDNVFDFLTVCHEKFDIIFADPPYAMEGFETLPDKIFERNILYDGNYFVLEHGDEHSFISHPYFKKEKRYGRVHFSFFVK
ncbi:MAG: RsmD family RNA methyltransferase [Bacteroidales bacterium]|nr:RsmD family RNA methyltransferase [Bacteroidales bacterium]MDY6000566.1 RsmD family RNA methyltransferase [Candidatus Cryptobacteroides sp.]